MYEGCSSFQASKEDIPLRPRLLPVPLVNPAWLFHLKYLKGHKVSQSYPLLTLQPCAAKILCLTKVHAGSCLNKRASLEI